MTGKSTDDGPADSLELLSEQTRVLVSIFQGWDATTPGSTDGACTVVEQNWDRGTLGKLLIEHAATRVAAKEDVARALRDIGEDRLADGLTGPLLKVRSLLDRLDELARGVGPMAVAASEDFSDTVEDLAVVIRTGLGAEADQLAKVAVALGERRSTLRSAKHISSHAPTHPGPHRRWYDDIPLLAHIHARYDHLRGFPWADSAALADTKLAERYNQPR